METLRDYLDFMKGRGLVLEIGEKVSREDIPELIELLADRGKVIHFKNIDGYECGMAANLAPSIDALSAVVGDCGRFLEAGNKVEKKVAVEPAGLTSIDMAGRDILSVLPILKHCEKDSAPFITTGIVSSPDPDSGVVGRGIHRLEYRGGDRLGVTLINPPLSDILQKCRARGERMRLVVTIGVDPVLFLSMAMKAAPGTDKLEVAGGLKGEGVKVIRPAYPDIDVPAGAEFYLEGEVDYADVRRDGPLGEIGGYYMALEATPTMVVSRIFHRPAPLYHALLPTGLEGDAYLTFVSRGHVEGTVRKLFPFVAEIVFVAKTFGTSVVVSIRPAERRQVRSLITCMMGFPMIKKVVVVDADVDAHNLADVEWAIMTRCFADVDVIVASGLQGQPIDPQSAGGAGVAKMGIDATTHGKHIEERARVAAGMRERVLSVLRSIGGAA
jgi:2,5-furandicarboxylate decarboxylase 1